MNRPSAPRARLPAFGKRILDLRRKGLVPAPPPCFVCLDSWKWAQSCVRVVVAPDNDPAALYYSMLAGLDVVVVYSSELSPAARIEALRTKLARCGVRFLEVDMMGPVYLVPGKSYSEMTHRDHIENCDRLLTLLSADRARIRSESAEHA